VDLEFVEPWTLLYQLTCRRLHGVSSINDSTFIAAVSDWQARVTNSTVAQQPFSTKETLWDEPLVRSQELSVLLAAPDQARLIAAAAPHSGAFLHARLFVAYRVFRSKK